MPDATKDVVIVTTTFYKDTTPLRFKLALETVKIARAEGYTIVIVDASPPEVRDQFVEAGAMVFPEIIRGMGQSRRLAFFLGAEMAKGQGAKALFWTEAEKHDIIRSIPAIYWPIWQQGADISVPERSEECWMTYPAFQVASEKEGNRLAAELNGCYYDLYFGPMMYALDAARYVIQANPKAWGIADSYVPQYMPTMARANGAKLMGAPVEFNYPPEQKAEEEAATNDAMRKKRADQFATVSHAHEVVSKIKL